MGGEEQLGRRLYFLGSVAIGGEEEEEEEEEENGNDDEFLYI